MMKWVAVWSMREDAGTGNTEKSSHLALAELLACKYLVIFQIVKRSARIAPFPILRRQRLRNIAAVATRNGDGDCSRAG